MYQSAKPDTQLTLRRKPGRPKKSPTDGLSAVTNNPDAWLGRVDQRTRFALRVKDLKQGFEADLGGAAHLSTAQAALVRQAAIIEARLELDHAALASGSAIDEGKHEKRAYLLCRVLGALFPGGMHRRARVVNEAGDFGRLLEHAAQQEAEGALLEEALS